MVKTTLDETEMKLSKIMEENHTLKGLLKMAKVDISESRKKITEFIEVDQDRELLRIKCEAYSKQILEIHDAAQQR